MITVLIFLLKKNNFTGTNTILFKRNIYIMNPDSPIDSVEKNLPANAGDTDSVSGL